MKQEHILHDSIDLKDRQANIIHVNQSQDCGYLGGKESRKVHEGGFCHAGNTLSLDWVKIIVQ